MNDDASTFDLPEYIHSRLMPVIVIDFPEADEARAILKQNLPFSNDEVLGYVVSFLQAAHAGDEPFTVRDGINIARYAIKRAKQAKSAVSRMHLIEAISRTLGEEALRYLKT